MTTLIIPLSIWLPVALTVIASTGLFLWSEHKKNLKDFRAKLSVGNYARFKAYGKTHRVQVKAKLSNRIFLVTDTDTKIAINAPIELLYMP